MNNELHHLTQINYTGAHSSNNYMLKSTGNLHIKQDLVEQTK